LIYITLHPTQYRSFRRWCEPVSLAHRVVSYDSVSSVRLQCRSGIKDSCHGVVGLMSSGLRQQRSMGASHNIQRARDASCTGQRSPVAATVRATEVESGRVGSGRMQSVVTHKLPPHTHAALSLACDTTDRHTRSDAMLSPSRQSLHCIPTRRRHFFSTSFEIEPILIFWYTESR